MILKVYWTNTLQNSQRNFSYRLKRGFRYFSVHNNLPSEILLKLFFTTNNQVLILSFMSSDIRCPFCLFLFSFWFVLRYLRRLITLWRLYYNGRWWKHTRKRKVHAISRVGHSWFSIHPLVWRSREGIWSPLRRFWCRMTERKRLVTKKFFSSGVASKLSLVNKSSSANQIVAPGMLSFKITHFACLLEDAFLPQQCIHPSTQVSPSALHFSLSLEIFFMVPKVCSYVQWAESIVTANMMVMDHVW